MEVIDERVVAYLWDPQDRRYALMEPVDHPPVGDEPEGAQWVNVQILARPASAPDGGVAAWYTDAIRAALRSKLIARCAEQGYTLLCVQDPAKSRAMIGHAPGTIAYLYGGWAIPPAGQPS